MRCWKEHQYLVKWQERYNLLQNGNHTRYKVNINRQARPNGYIGQEQPGFIVNWQERPAYGKLAVAMISISNGQ